ncbi:hypothetical protein QYM36_003005 [Artemia franciscana]|uniref:Reverse transcriptase domain-containing protein n=1 Tax=Artemia franciscana TaxID=6661 RepID=A0AA88I7E3_ARTSF|nr:hypothetical protein QYM36_003005 [Artemia franciscana]
MRFWNTIHKVCSSKPPPVLPIHIQKSDGSQTSSYAEAGEELLKKWFPSDDLQSESFYHKNIRNEVKEKLDLCEGAPEPIALDSLEDIIKSLKPLKAPGPDGIVSLVIQKNFGVLSPTLLKIYNACLSLKYFPRAWKEANVIVLLKRGKSNDGISSSYRPISLLSHLGKVLEKIILNRVFETNLESEWVSNEQFGFVKNRSTIDALDKLVTIVENDQKSKRYTLSLFFDIKGAFDNAWHPGILYKLVDKGFDLSLIKIIESYLSDRCAMYGNSSDFFNTSLEKSCPQGGILSPFLWLINIDDLLRVNFGRHCVVQAYADDICATISADTPQKLIHMANGVFMRFCEWAGNNKLKFDENKTEALLFTRKHKVPDITLMFMNTRVEIKEKVRYLGVILDRKLSWNEHGTTRVNAAKQYSLRLMSAAKPHGV